MVTRDLQHLASSESVQNFIRRLYRSEYAPQKFLDCAHQFQPSYRSSNFQCSNPIFTTVRLGNERREGPQTSLPSTPLNSSGTGKALSPNGGPTENQRQANSRWLANGGRTAGEQPQIAERRANGGWRPQVDERRLKGGRTI